MKPIKQYDLHKDDYSKLHFEVNDARPYYLKHKVHAAVPHRHSFYQIIWFKSAGRHFVDYETIDHPENTVFFINKNQIHNFCTDAPNEGFLFHFNDLFLDRHQKGMIHRFSTSVFNEIGGNHLVLPEADIKNIGLLTSFIQSEILSQETSFKEQVYHYFLNVLILIERLRNKQGTVNTPTNEDYQLASQFKRLVFEQIDQFHSIDYFASELGTNTKRLTEISKEFLGNTPANLIKESKLLEAKRMMSNQKVSIKEIAYSLGFEDPTYFTKYFKKGTGMTPKEFQKLHF